MNTTLAYIKEAEDRDKLRGAVFPTLPNEVVWPDGWTSEKTAVRKNRPSAVPEEGVEPEKTRGSAPGSGNSCEPKPRVETRTDDEQRDRSLARLAAKARIVEALSSGDVRVLAAELVEGLEALAGTARSAEVIPFTHRRR